MPTQTPALTPPPNPIDESSQVSDVPFSMKERGLGVAAKNSGQGSLAEKMLEQHHQQRLAEARMHKRNASTAVGRLLYDDNMKEKAKSDPNAAQGYTFLTDKERQDLNAERLSATAAYEKIVGVNKDAKGALNKAKMIVEHLLGRGQQQRQGGMQPPPAAPGASQDISMDEKMPFLRQSMEEQHAADQSFDKFSREETLKHKHKMEELEDKQPTTLDAAWLKAFRDENGREPKPDEITAHYVGEREKPLDAAVQEGIDKAKAGDIEGAKKIFDTVQQAAGAKKGGVSTGASLLAVIDRANKGDAAAKKDLSSYMALQKDLALARGQGLGMGRSMYQIGAYIDGTEGSPTQGQMIPMSNYDAIQAIRAGKTLVPAGRMPANMATAAQRLTTEGTPAISEVRKYLKAYDNESDRAIFARAMNSAGVAPYGEESTWLGNVLSQVANDKLSPDGQKLKVRLARLNETIGTARQALGAPATDTSMALMKALVPGPTVSSSALAGDMIDQLEQNIKNAVEIPVLSGVTPRKGGAKPPPTPPDKTKPRVIHIPDN